MHMLIVVAALAFAAVTPFLSPPPTNALSSFEEPVAGDEAEAQDAEAD